MRYRRNPWLRIFLGMTVALSGCNVTKATEQPPVPLTVKQEEIQSAQERDMVILFQSLVQMDKKDGLMLSRRQAEDMLPLVRRNSTDGELSQADQQLIVSLLSKKQKAYVDDFQEHLLNRKQSLTERKYMDDLTIEQREQMIKEFQMRRQQRDQEQGHQSTPEMNIITDDEDLSSTGAFFIPGGSGGGANNVEQQLIELLEGRLVSEPTK
ncbi:hypothetical protein [Paenibacillus rigui]|uniref:Uncharacterized protein n=1 Tax=Paenibacillus rigui TaxID=554312 RepID=A0A229UWZ4_9BACL|nr:hypothetical protein [Paenibacillus rigui]OXM87944.1 hypothetical protein CF651_02240 [Paenibacillus rigui]